MNKSNTTAKFTATLLRPAKLGKDTPPAFIVLPKEISELLPRRGRTSVDIILNNYSFQTTLEPDGQLSHWLPLSDEIMKGAVVNIGDLVSIELMPVAQEPEPNVPLDIVEALTANPDALKVWETTTAIARVDWLHWITSAKQAKTREKRKHDACEMLASGKRRVCCFDPSGFYSKALSAPKAAD